MGLKNFFRTLLLSLNPGKYDILSERLTKDSLKYFVLMVLFIFIVSALLFIPKLATLPKYLEDEFSGFEQLEVNVEQGMKEPVVLTENHPLIIIDTEGKTKEFDNVLVTNKGIYIKTLFGIKKISTEGYSNLLEKKDKISNFLLLIFIMMLPMLLLLAFVYFLVKYFLIVILALILGFIIARLIKFEIKVSELFRIGLYATTVMAVVELITLPFVPFVYYAQYILFGIYFILGAIKSGNFGVKSRR